MSGSSFGIERAVFGEIEAASGFEDDGVEAGSKLPEPFAVAFGDRKVEREGVAVHRVGHQESVAPMAFEDAQIGNDPFFVAGLKLSGEAGFGGGGGDKALVLDQAAGL